MFLGFLILSGCTGALAIWRWRYSCCPRSRSWSHPAWECQFASPNARRGDFDSYTFHFSTCLEGVEFFRSKHVYLVCVFVRVLELAKISSSQLLTWILLCMSLSFANHKKTTLMVLSNASRLSPPVSHASPFLYAACEASLLSVQSVRCNVWNVNL